MILGRISFGPPLDPLQRQWRDLSRAPRPLTKGQIWRLYLEGYFTADERDRLLERVGQ